MTVAAVLVQRLADRGQTVAFAESLTGGAVAREVVLVPGASAVLQGAVVAYQNAVKSSVLGVSEPLLATSGAVCGPVAAQMAAGVARLVQADWGFSTTGVAGPGPADGWAAGTAFVGWWHAQQAGWLRVAVPGARTQVMAGVSAALLRWAAVLLAGRAQYPAGCQI